MANKTIGIILNLKDNFSGQLKQATKGTNDFSKRVKHSGNNVKNFGKQATSGFKSVAKSIMGMAAAYISISAIKNFANESVEAAKAQIDAETKLEAVLKNVTALQEKSPTAYLEGLARLKTVAADLQRTGGLGDEIMLAGFQELATFNVDDTIISSLSTGMADLLAQQKGLNATQEDAVNISKMIGKALNGQTTSLKRIGMLTDEEEKALKKANTQEERAVILSQALENHVGGVNEALAKTPAGKIKNMKNQWGDFKEQVGLVVLELESKFAGWFATKIPIIRAKFQQFVEKFKEYIPTIKMVGQAIIVIGTKIIALVKTIATWIAPLIKAIMKLISTGVYLITHWQEVKQKARAIWESIKQNFVTKVEEIKTKIKELPHQMIERGREMLTNLWEGIKEGLADLKEKWRTKVASIFTLNPTGKLNLVTDISKPGKYATGTSYFQGGLARINEHGGELVTLPSGSKILPADKTAQVMNNKNNNVTLNVYYNNNNPDVVVSDVVRKLKLALDNM